MVKLIAVTVFLGVLITGMAHKCNEKDIADCVKEVRKSVLAIMENRMNADQKSYCEFLMKKGTCMTEIAEDCKKTKPKVSTLMTSFKAYLTHMCTDDGKVQMELAPCFEKYKTEFKECSSGGGIEAEDAIERVCESIYEKECEAGVMKKNCKENESFAKALEKHIKVLEEDVCMRSVGSNIVSFGLCHWILAIIIILLSKRDKF